MPCRPPRSTARARRFPSALLSLVVAAGACTDAAPTAAPSAGRGLFQNGQYLNYEHQFTNVVAEVTPEPATWVLFGAGLGGVLLVARRRRSV